MFQVYYVNRMGNGGLYEARTTTFNGNLQLLAVNGSLYSNLFASSFAGTSSVVTFRIQPPVANPTPNPNAAVQLSAAQRLSAVRYVRVNAAAGQCLHFREIMVSAISHAS